MSKISDNASDGSFNNQYSNDANGVAVNGSYQYPKKKKGAKNAYNNMNMKKGPLAT